MHGRLFSVTGSVVLVTSATLALAAPGIGRSGPTHHNVHFTSTIDAATVGNDTIYEVHNSVGPRVGAGIAKTTVTSPTTATDVATTYYGNGKAVAHDSYQLSAPDANGIITLTGTGRDVSGTGVWKYVKSRYTVKGTLDSKTGIAHVKLTGTITY